MRSHYIGMSRTLRLALLLMSLACVTWADDARSTVVAMVTDLQGRASRIDEGPPRDLTILTELQAASQVQVAPGAVLSVLYLDAGAEYVFRGPSRIVFETAAPVVKSGGAAERRTTTSGKGAQVRLKPMGLTQAAIVLRTGRLTPWIKLLSLNNTHSLDQSPQFRWTGPEPGAHYEIQIADDTGLAVHGATVSGTTYRLPAGVSLKEGVVYRWKVATQLSDGRHYSSNGEFAIASAEMRAQAEAIKPRATDPLSTRIVYAAWLDQMQLKDEARRYWQAAALERPDDTRLSALSAQ